MRRDWKYIAFLAASVIIYLLARFFSPKEFDWTITLDPADKNPYGAYAFAQLVPTALEGTSVHLVNNTFYELMDSLAAPSTVFSISTSFDPGKADVDELLRDVEKGGHAFITADNFGSRFSDTLKITSDNYMFNTKYYNYANTDSGALKTVYPDTLAENNAFLRHNILNYFSSYDSSKTTVVATNDLGLPVTIVVPEGRGYFVLNTTPLAFSNIGILHGRNSHFIEQELSFLPADHDFYWTNYYQEGRMQIATPLRVILTTPSLRWAYYIGIGALLLFLLFEVKRKQRIIPIVKPLTNTTLEFVQTIGNMYFEDRDYHGIASRQIAFLLERIRERYRLPTVQMDEHFIDSLSLRSGADRAVIKDLVDEIINFESKAGLTEKELIALNRKIEKFTTIAFKTKDS